MRVIDVAVVVGWVLTTVVLAHPAEATSAADFVYRNSEPSGTGLPYRVFVPAACVAPMRCPVILFLHGAGERGSNNISQLNNRANHAMDLVDGANLAAQPMLMIAPQCPTGQNWASTQNQTYLADILEDVDEEFGYDPDRVYLTGLSLGGNGTWITLKNYTTFFAAGVPLAGWGSTSAATAAARVPQWAFHAANDGTVGVAGSRDMIAGLRAAGGDPAYTEFASGNHAIWDDVYPLPEVFGWLRSHRRWRPGGAAPQVHVTSPTESEFWATTGSAVTVTGTADDAASGPAAVAWEAEWGANGSASGTASWTTGTIGIPAGSGRVRVIAEGDSLVAALGGATSFSDSIVVTSASGPNQPPVVVVGGPSLGVTGERLHLHAAVTDDGFPTGDLEEVSWQVLAGPEGAVLTADGPTAILEASAPGHYLVQATADDGADEGSGSLELLVLGGTEPPVVAAVNCNGPAIAGETGIDFVADDWFSGGSTSSSSLGVLGTRDDAVYQTYRWGTFGYSIPLPVGRYFLVLLTAETYNLAVGERRFDVSVEGAPWLDDLDVLERTGRNTAFSAGRELEVLDGHLDIGFSNGTAGNAMIHGLIVVDLDAAEGALFADGFEGGSTARWSSVGS